MSASPLEAAFPALTRSETLRTALREETQEVTLTPGEFVCMEGTTCASLALVLDGTARVYKSGASGREITLYRVEPGESCILTTSCILGDRPFPAFAAAETVLTARLVPAAAVRAWMDAHPPWRRYVFALFAARLDAVIATLEEVTFRQLDVRLARHLVAASDGADGAVVRATHEQLAADLGSAREVISRLLKDFEHKGLVTLRRGAVGLDDRAGLKRMASGTDSHVS